LAIPDLAWTVVSFILTLLVFSYIFGDNPVFRFSLALLVGCTTGYFAVILIQQFIGPQILLTFQSGNFQLAAVPLILSILLLFRLIPRYSRLGNIPLGFLVGTSAAVIIGGAIFGTLIPQVNASIRQFSSWQSLASPVGLIKFLEGGLILFGTATSLLYFQFTLRKRDEATNTTQGIFGWMRLAGKFFIVATLGAVFAGVFSASITALVSRLAFLWESVRLLIG
jgi:hypothetical protein